MTQQLTPNKLEKRLVCLKIEVIISLYVILCFGYALACIQFRIILIGLEYVKCPRMFCSTVVVFFPPLLPLLY